MLARSKDLHDKSKVWGETVGRARKMDDLPMWLQYYPKTLFDTINRRQGLFLVCIYVCRNGHDLMLSCSGVISKKELKLFYTAFLDAGKLDERAVAELTDKSYKAMTSNGEVQLTFHMYKLSFLNFLLGKQPNGPGEWLFGEVDREGGRQENFHIDLTLWSKAGEGHAFAKTVNKESEIERVCCEIESEDVAKGEKHDRPSRLCLASRPLTPFQR